MFALLILIFQVEGGPAPVVVQQSISWITVALALVGGLPATVAAIGGVMALLQSRQNAVVAAQTDMKVDEVRKDNGKIIEKATEIHTLTNGSLHQVTNELKAANVKIEGFAATQVANNKKIERLESMLEKLAEHVAPIQAEHPISGDPEEPVPVIDEAAVGKLDKIIEGNIVAPHKEPK